jgi:hypothetical protein
MTEIEIKRIADKANFEQNKNRENNINAIEAYNEIKTTIRALSGLYVVQIFVCQDNIGIYFEKNKDDYPRVVFKRTKYSIEIIHNTNIGDDNLIYILRMFWDIRGEHIINDKTVI